MLRVVRESAVAPLEDFLSSRAYRALVADGRLLPVERASDVDSQWTAALSDMIEPGWVAYSQPLLEFLSYPHEWPSRMLHAAATLTIDIARDVLTDGWGLKDATPFNIGYAGARPVYLDILSFERRNPRDPIWLPYGQFVRTCLLPLLVRDETRAPLSMRGREGIEPEELARAMSLGRKLRPAALSLVTIPSLLGVRQRATLPTMDPEKARYVLSRVLASLDRKTRDLEPIASKSRWTRYADETHNEAYHTARKSFVQRLLKASRPQRVLDIGCNTGTHSIIAARNGAAVVAIDADAAVADRLFVQASADALNILPLVIDVADPTPGRGWRNAEHAAFLERAAGQFDMVMALAVMHHIMIGNGVPLTEFLDLIADLTTYRAVIEFIPADDPMLRELARGRDALYATHSRESFIRSSERRFVLESSEIVGVGGREIFVLTKRPV